MRKTTWLVVFVCVCVYVCVIHLVCVSWGVNFETLALLTLNTNKVSHLSVFATMSDFRTKVHKWSLTLII
jgi:hypothetical protein